MSHSNFDSRCSRIRSPTAARLFFHLVIPISSIPAFLIPPVPQSGIRNSSNINQEGDAGFSWLHGFQIQI